MTVAELTTAGIPIADDAAALLRAKAALEWMKENTTLSIDLEDSKSVEALPSCAKLFVVKYSEVLNLNQGVASQSIEGLSMSFSSTDRSSLLWQLANTLLGAYLKSQVRFYPAKRRW